MSDGGEQRRVSCPNCGKGYRWKPDYAGRKVRCKDCREVFTFPESASDAGAGAGGGEAVRESEDDSLEGLLNGSRAPAGLQDADESRGGSAFSGMSSMAPTSELAMSTAAEFELEGSGTFHELIDEAAASQSTRGKVCPECGHVCDPEAVLCVGCGYNFETGEIVQYMSPEDEASGRSGLAALLPGRSRSKTGESAATSSASKPEKGSKPDRPAKSSKSAKPARSARSDESDTSRASMNFQMREIGVPLIILAAGVLLQFWASSAYQAQVEAENVRLKAEWEQALKQAGHLVEPEPAPDFSLKTLDGQTWRLSDHTPPGIVVLEVVNPTRRYAASHALKVAEGVEAFSDLHPDQSVTAALVLRDEGEVSGAAYYEEKIAPLLADSGRSWPGPVLMADERFIRQYEATGKFQTIVIDDGGMIQGQLGHYFTRAQRKEFDYRLGELLVESLGASERRAAEAAEAEAARPTLSDAAKDVTAKMLGQLILGVPLAIVAMFLVAGMLQIGFGSLPVAVVKAAAIFVFPPALGELLFVYVEAAVPYLGIFVYIVVATGVYWGLIAWLFALDLFETMVFAVALWFLRFIVGAIGVVLLADLLT